MILYTRGLLQCLWNKLNCKTYFQLLTMRTETVYREQNFIQNAET